MKCWFNLPPEERSRNFRAKINQPALIAESVKRVERSRVIPVHGKASAVLYQWESNGCCYLVLAVNSVLLAWLLSVQSGVCGCEKGYTEVMTTHGFLDYCTRTPGVDSNKKADVKTNSGRLKPGPSQAQDLFNEWTLRPVGPGTEMGKIFTAWAACLRSFLFAN